MKPTTKILMALSALLSINALALFEGVARSVDNTAASLTRPITGKPRPDTRQSTSVPQQGVNTYGNKPAGYGIKPMPNKPGFNRRPPVLKDPRVTQQGYGKKPFYGNFSNQQPVNNPQINPRYVGSSEFEKSHMPQDTHPVNVLHTSDDEIML